MKLGKLQRILKETKYQSIETNKGLGSETLAEDRQDSRLKQNRKYILVTPVKGS